MAEAAGKSKVAFNMTMVPTTINLLDFFSGDLKKKFNNERKNVTYNWLSWPVILCDSILESKFSLLFNFTQN